MTPDLPVSARLAWWGTAWLRGQVSPDELIDEVPHSAGLLGLLATWRAEGCTGLALALPVEGDPLGLGGPPDLTADVIDLGECVLALGTGHGLLPPTPAHRAWLPTAAVRGTVPDLGEADRALRTEVVTTARRLADLDVARWRPEAADALMNLRHRPHVDHPAGWDPRCVDLAARALQAEGIVALAAGDDGAAVSAHEMAHRRHALDDLDRAARRALVAACSPDAWPPADGAA